MLLYLAIFALGGLVYFFLLSKEAKRTSTLFFVLGGMGVFVILLIGLMFNYAANFFEVLFYLLALALTIQAVRELEKL